MWPSWLWVTPLGEMPAVLCPPHVWHLRQGRCAAGWNAVRVPAVQSQQDAGTFMSFLPGPHLILHHRFLKAQAAAWCARPASLLLTAYMGALQGHDAQ